MSCAQELPIVTYWSTIIPDHQLSLTQQQQIAAEITHPRPFQQQAKTFREAMTVLAAVGKVMSLIAFITTMLGKAARALEPHCYCQQVFNGKVWYTAFLPADFPEDQNAYCNNIWAQLMIHGQINATDPGWFACQKCKVSGWDGLTQLTIADEPSGAGWVGRWLQATFPQEVPDANICGRSFPANAIPTCQLFNDDGNTTNTTISIPCQSTASC